MMLQIEVICILRQSEGDLTRKSFPPIREAVHSARCGNHQFSNWLTLRAQGEAAYR